MSGETAQVAVPRSRYPQARGVLWIAQWAAVVLLPVWLVLATELVLPHTWAVIGMFIYAALLFLLLLVAAILSLVIPPTRRRRGGPWYVWLLVGVWACVAVLPFLAENLFEGEGFTPSALERLGLPQSVDGLLYQLCFWGGATMIALAWIAALAAGAPRPFGEGPPRTKRPTRQQVRERLDELNSWRP